MKFIRVRGKIVPIRDKTELSTKEKIKYFSKKADQFDRSAALGKKVSAGLFGLSLATGATSLGIYSAAVNVKTAKAAKALALAGKVGAFSTAAALVGTSYGLLSKLDSYTARVVRKDVGALKRMKR